MKIVKLSQFGTPQKTETIQYWQNLIHNLKFSSPKAYKQLSPELLKLPEIWKIIKKELPQEYLDNCPPNIKNQVESNNFTLTDVQGLLYHQKPQQYRAANNIYASIQNGQLGWISPNFKIYSYNDTSTESPNHIHILIIEKLIDIPKFFQQYNIQNLPSNYEKLEIPNTNSYQHFITNNGSILQISNSIIKDFMISQGWSRFITYQKNYANTNSIVIQTNQSEEWLKNFLKNLHQTYVEIDHNNYYWNGTIDSFLKFGPKIQQNLNVANSNNYNWYKLATSDF